MPVVKSVYLDSCDAEAGRFGTPFVTPGVRAPHEVVVARGTPGPRRGRAAKAAMPSTREDNGAL